MKRDLQNELRGLPPRQILKPDAVPDMNPPKNVASSAKDFKATIKIQPIMKSPEILPSPKIWLDSGRTSFEKRRSSEMMKMDEALHIPETVVEKEVPSTASERPVVPEDNTIPTPSHGVKRYGIIAIMIYN